MGNPMLRVLAYHRVADPATSPLLNPRLISASPDGFERQMRYLARHYRVVSMADVLHAVQRGRSLPDRAILITFDDAYVDFAHHAWPVLRQLGLPATVFVPTAFPDQPDRAFWWDRLYRAVTTTSVETLAATPLGPLPCRTPAERQRTLRRLQNYVKTLPHAAAMQLVEDICRSLGSQPIAVQATLSWRDLRHLASSGVTLAPHTRTHPILTQLSSEAMREEIVGSLCDLQREVGNILPVFCYPNGNYNAAVAQVLREEGFVLAFTAHDGRNDLRSVDRLGLNRTSITQRTSPFIFRLRLLPAVIELDRWRHGRRRRQLLS